MIKFCFSIDNLWNKNNQNSVLPDIFKWIEMKIFLFRFYFLILTYNNLKIK